MARQTILSSILFLLFFVSISHAYVPSGFNYQNNNIATRDFQDEVLFHNDDDFTPSPILLAQLESDVVSDANSEMSEEEIDEEDDDFDDFEEEFEEAAKDKVSDPLSGYNRFMTNVNDKLYFWIVKPVAKGYNKVVPEGARRAIVRFFNNLLFPVRFVNNVLQFKFKRAGTELARFGVNTTVGILGFGDPAKNWFDLKAYPEDFGQTLGHYGVGSGFHIVLPVLGPSNLRDLVGLVPDYFMEPISHIKKNEEELAVNAYKRLNETSLHLGEYESIKKDALDLYPFLRDAYEQIRKKKIKE